MPKIIVLDVKSDRGGSGMEQMLNDGAFHPKLGCILKNLMKDIFPVEGEFSREMWPGVGFPVGDPMHAILNHLYATAQRPLIPADIMAKIAREASNVMEVHGGFDDEIKGMVMRGSSKVYDRVMPDGTHVRIEISKPIDPMDKLNSMVVNKKASAHAVNAMTFDCDKLIRKAGYMQLVGHNYDKEVAALLSKVKEHNTFALNVKQAGSEIENLVTRMANDSKVSTDTVLNSGAPDIDSKYKALVNGVVIDTRKLKAKPFDSFQNATKAVGKQVADIVCDRLSGNISMDKLKQLEEFAANDPLMEKLLDNLTSILVWK